MTAAQKAAKANFKKAIEYRKKTGVSLKEAFAHVYGKKKVGAAPKKKAAKKKSAPKKKATKKVVKKAAKKSAPKKSVRKVVKKSAPKRSVNLHKDTKSHNVRISVVSGINRELLQDLMKVQKNRDHYMKIADKLNVEYMYLKKQKGPLVNSQKIANRKYYKQVVSVLKELIAHQNQIRKNLK
jgi:hypothetical protein